MLGFEWAGRDGKDWKVVAIADFDHVPIRVVEERLIHLDPSFLHHRRGVFHSQFFQPPLHQSNITALSQEIPKFLSSLLFMHIITIQQNYDLTLSLG